MRLKVTVASLVLLMANNVWAQDEPYYTYEEINVTAEGALYGPFPVAMSEDETFIATYSMKASLSSNVDIGLPFTFNKDCQYDDVICELQFYGSETAGQDSYENAYQDWRNAQSEAEDGTYDSYMMANTLSYLDDNGQVIPFDLGGNTTDVKVTDVYTTEAGDNYIIGYSSAPYVEGVREFSRRAFIQLLDGNVVELLPYDFGADDDDVDDNGGFSSAYKIKEVIDTETDISTFYVIGAASVSYPQDTTEYFEDCYSSDEDNDRYDVNDLVLCPGFDTQAWAWDVTDIINGVSVETELEGESIATTWLEDNETNQNDLTFSASAFDMDSSGIAVGASTFQYSSSDEGGRQRAIIMTPSEGVYAEPTEITSINNDIDDQDDNIHNTWALTISEAGIVTGNREFSTPKGRNEAIEFFVYDHVNDSILRPFLNKKVATTKQREENSSYYITKNGANSRIYDANETDWMVGEVDDYDQTDPVYDGSPRSQAAFLYDQQNDQAWLINDLLCRQSEGVVSLPDPLMRVRSARVINDSNIVLAEGFTYDSNDDYTNRTNGIKTSWKLTPTSDFSPNDSPNCWDSELLQSIDESYERQGGGTLWLWVFSLPFIFIRRFRH